MVSETNRPGAAVNAEAAAWLARLQGPQRSTDTDAGLQAWLMADPAHRQAFERATEIWDIIPGTQPERAVVPPEQARLRWHPALLAIAASLLVLVAAGGGYAWLRPPPGYETAVGGQQVVLLDDGSRVSLNTNSRITVRFSDAERGLVLERGEAMFEVAHNAARPFVVYSGDERVRALGTTFVVRRDSGGKVSVTLVEGKVEVSGLAQARAARIAILTPGQRISVTPTAGAALDRPSLDAVTAWRRGEVVFEDISLIAAAEELNRYSKTHLVIADPAIASLRISGSFSTGDVGEVAAAIAALHGLRVRRGSNDIRLTRR